MSLTISIGQYYIQDLDNHNSKTCYIEINHGKQSVRTTSIPFIENKKGYVANFSHFLEILDHEHQETIELCVWLEENNRSWRHRLLLLVMSEFRGSPEKRFIINDSPLIPTTSSSSTRIYADSIDKENIELTLVYSNDWESPSLLNFIICGLCLCPGVRPESENNIIGSINRNLSRMRSTAIETSNERGNGKKQYDHIEIGRQSLY